MGKKRLEKLLTDLKDNHQRDLKNAAEIYTVAQVAVNQLSDEKNEGKSKKKTKKKPEAETLKLGPSKLVPSGHCQPHTIEDLKTQYITVAACRKALKDRGLTFSKVPSWEKLAIALNCFEAQQAFLTDYLQQHPSNDFPDCTLTFRPHSTP
jgi:intracellular sulfur oxidation DsrE/DsrF family protein